MIVGAGKCDICMAGCKFSLDSEFLPLETQLCVRNAFN